MPLEVAQTGSSADAGGRRPSKFEEQGKKFGRKMGNAGKFEAVFLYLEWLLELVSNIFTAIFGAGATIGSNIVNGIF